MTHAAVVALLPAAATAWYQPLARYSYARPAMRYYASDPFWPQPFARPPRSSLSLSPSFDELASRVLSLHSGMFDNIFDELAGVERWQQDEDAIFAAFRIGAGLRQDSISASLNADGTELTISGCRAPRHTFESTISLPFSVADAAAIGLEYNAETGVLSVRAPKTAARHQTPVEITMAPAAGRIDQPVAADGTEQMKKSSMDEAAAAPQERDENTEQAEQEMLDEKYGFVKEAQTAASSDTSSAHEEKA